MLLTSSLVACFCLFLVSYVDCLTLVLVSMGDNPEAGITVTGPAMDVAIRDAIAKYDGVFRNATRTIYYKPGVMSCPVSTEAIMDEAGNIWKKIIDTDDSVALFTTGCSLETMLLGDFAREWNVLLVPTQAGSAVFANRERYGTTVVFGPTDFGVLTEATVFFLDFFGWNTVTLLCELLTPEQQERSSFNSVGCTSTRKALINGSGKYIVHITYFDPTNPLSFRTTLRKVAQESRIILVYSDIATIRKVLVTAAALGMTSGDYVYLTAQSLATRVDGQELWRSNDADDPIAFEAMRSFIFINSQPVNWRKSGKTAKDIAEESRKNYNPSCKLEEVNDLAISAYEAVSSFAEVIHNVPEDILKDGRKLAQQFFDRTFKFESRDILINKQGIRSAPINFWRLDNESKVFELAWTYSRTHRFHLNQLRLSNAWPNRSAPPPDVPLCGFQHEICDVQSRIQVVGMSVGAAAALAFFVVVVLLVRRAYYRTVHSNRATWLLKLDPTRLARLDEAQLRQSSLRDPLLSTFQENIRVYDDVWFWLERSSKTIPTGQVMSDSKAVSLAATAKAINHPNLTEFFGVYSDALATNLVWKYGNRGTLRSFLDSGRVSSELRVPVCWDVISGLQFLQRVGLKFHGRLSSLSCMVDRQFTVQLCGAITSRFWASFSAVETGLKADAERFWMAPEQLSEKLATGSCEADTYSLGIVLCEIVSGRYPMDINLTSAQGLAEKAALLDTTADRIFPGPSVTLPVRSQLAAMMNPSPGIRPTLSKTVLVFGRSYPRANAIDSLLKRMERFADELEDQVVARSKDLIEEQRKVDSLLEQIVPSRLVWELRNKRSIPPETFDSFTLLFSALPLFAEICFVSTPAQIVALLHNVYVLFDRILSTSDAYKVETIKDSYMVASGLPVRNGDLHAGCIAGLALQMRTAVHAIQCPVRDSEGLVLRIGIHSDAWPTDRAAKENARNLVPASLRPVDVWSIPCVSDSDFPDSGPDVAVVAFLGACVAAVIGRVMPRYCLFGDTINTCSRMETSGLPDKIHVSCETKSLLERASTFQLLRRGHVFLKGKGDVETFWLEKDQPTAPGRVLSPVSCQPDA